MISARLCIVYVWLNICVSSICMVFPLVLVHVNYGHGQDEEGDDFGDVYVDSAQNKQSTVCHCACVVALLSEACNPRPVPLHMSPLRDARVCCCPLWCCCRSLFVCCLVTRFRELITCLLVCVPEAYLCILLWVTCVAAGACVVAR